jgi:hypothetical protein
MSNFESVPPVCGTIDAYNIGFFKFDMKIYYAKFFVAIQIFSLTYLQ